MRTKNDDAAAASPTPAATAESWIAGIPTAAILPRAGELHLWRVPLPEAPEARSVEQTDLSGDERARAAAFQFDRDRNRFVRRRVALRTVLAGYLGAAPLDIEYRPGQQGKPDLAGKLAASGLTFNATSSAELALIACGRGIRIGVDAERTRADRDLPAIAHRFFSAAEYAAYCALDPAVRTEAFYRCWTRKEAVLKGVGGGLSLPLDAFDVTLNPAEPAKILRWEIPGAPRAAWSLHHLAPGAGYIGALATDGDPGEIRLWTLNE